MTCLDCAFKANFTLGIELEANITTVSKASINFTVIELEQPVDLEVVLGQSFSHTLNFTYVFQYSRRALVQAGSDIRLVSLRLGYLALRYVLPEIVLRWNAHREIDS